jgi:hypothetical protein
MGGNGMKVWDLINELQTFDGDAEIRIAQPTHNYWHTINAVEIDFVDAPAVGESGQIYDSAADAVKNEDAPTWMVVIR